MLVINAEALAEGCGKVICKVFVLPAVVAQTVV